MGDEPDKVEKPKEPIEPRPHIGTEIEKRGRDNGDTEHKDRDKGS